MKAGRIALVLGAGASKAYGYPVGKALCELLKLPVSLLDYQPSGPTWDVDGFRRHFRDSRQRSIDAFLARSMRYADIGKTAIAKILLECEKASGLVESEDANDDWYAYLVERLFVERWCDFDPSWLSIITFNYDRSLEQLLLTSAMATYGLSATEASERLDNLKIVHVYGSIGSVTGGDPAYGAIWERKEDDHARSARIVQQAASAIRVIPEGRDDDESLQPARDALQRAEVICFLGFSFDQTNVRRLGAPEAFLNEAGKPKQIAATTLGLTRAEARRAYGSLFEGTKYSNQELPGHFVDCPCERLLRETLVLG